MTMTVGVRAFAFQPYMTYKYCHLLHVHSTRMERCLAGVDGLRSSTPVTHSTLMVAAGDRIGVAGGSLASTV